MTMSDRDERLDALADEARRKAMELASRTELLTPVLLVEDNDLQVHRYLLQGPSHPSEAMKVLIYAHRAVRAAICLEGWAVEAQASSDEENDAWKRSLLRGTLPPGLTRARDHAQRFDVLTLLAQNGERPAGYSVHQAWRIEPGSPRTFTLSDREGAIDMPSNFWPMFTTPDIIRQLIRFDAALQGLRDQTRRRQGEQGA